MATTTTAHDVWTDADDDAADIGGYLPRLTELARQRGPRVHDGSARRKVSGSPAPWNVPAAHLLLDIHAEARELADTLAVALGHHPHRYGTGEDGTAAALVHVARQARALAERDQDRHLPGYAVEKLRGWGRRARRLLDEPRPDEEPWTRAPGDLRCPNPIEDVDTGLIAVCDAPLWLAPGWQHQTSPAVHCRRCLDDDGHPYSWPHAAWYGLVIECAS